MKIEPNKPEPVPIRSRVSASARSSSSAPAAADHFSAVQRENFLSALRSQPAARAEAVSRGVELANDPDYPSEDVIQNVARRLTRGQ